jgi:hypothetical protein
VKKLEKNQVHREHSIFAGCLFVWGLSRVKNEQVLTKYKDLQEETWELSSLTEYTEKPVPRSLDHAVTIIGFRGI